MILDEIKEAYFKHEYHNVIGIKLLINFNTYTQMLREDDRLIGLIRPTQDGELPPMFGRPVFLKHDLDQPWVWSAN